MSLETKITELITSETYLALSDEAKPQALLAAIAEFAQDNAEQIRIQAFYTQRDAARSVLESSLSEYCEGKRQEFNTKWQSYEDNNYTIIEE
jgi:hypothetical protein